MSLKVTTGMVPGSNMRELHSSNHIREMIAKMNVAYRPRLIVIDGVEAFVDGGPMTGTSDRRTSPLHRTTWSPSTPLGWLP